MKYQPQQRKLQHSHSKKHGSHVSSWSVISVSLDTDYMEIMLGAQADVISALVRNYVIGLQNWWGKNPFFCSHSR